VSRWRTIEAVLAAFWSGVAIVIVFANSRFNRHKMEKDPSRFCGLPRRLET
jgi:hypothetical protein